jgi:hypothetical protein
MPKMQMPLPDRLEPETDEIEVEAVGRIDTRINWFFPLFPGKYLISLNTCNFEKKIFHLCS